MFEVVVIQVLWEPLAFTIPNFELRVKGLASFELRVSSLVFVERNVGGRKLNIFVT